MAEHENNASSYKPAKKRRKQVEEKPTDNHQNQHSKKKYSWEKEDTPERGLLVIALFALAALSFLSFINAAGDFGVAVDKFLGYVFGWGRYASPVIFGSLGYIFLHPNKYKVRALNYIGLIFFVLSGLGLLHLFLPPFEFISLAKEGRGGGYGGVILSYPLIKYAGIWASVVILAGLFVGSGIIMLNTTLKRLVSAFTFGNFFGKIFRFFRSRLHAKINGYAISSQENTEDAGELGQSVINENVENTFTIKNVTTNEGTSNREKPHQLSLMPSQQRRPRIKIDIPLNLLADRDDKPTAGDIEENKLKIKTTLENFGIEVEMGEVHVGPVVSQYTLKPADGVKITQITTLNNDIALALAAHPVRIEAPIPGKSLVGIEVPNKVKAAVTLKELLSSKAFKGRSDNLTVTLGKDVSGKPFLDSLERLPHLLIAGATGSGKSVCIHSLIISMLFQNTPEDLKLILVDPKRVELTLYNGVPHLLTPVITNVEKTINALKWTIVEMDRRYELLEKGGKRNLASYNAVIEEEERLPYIIFVIDELADLMATAANAVEAAIVRLAQMSRAVGIHLVLATQRPSVNVITGLIKANMPARIAFAVASLVDSRTILDFSGAEKLLGRGDMLYINAELSKPKRLQGALVEEKEIDRIAGYLRSKARPQYDSEVTEKISTVTGNNAGVIIDDEASDELLDEAKEIIIQAGKASASLLQRRLRIGYARAARILDILEEQGIIGPADGAKPREILLTDNKKAKEEIVLKEHGGNDNEYAQEENHEELDLGEDKVTYKDKE